MKLEQANHPRPGQLSPCHVCKEGAYTTKVEIESGMVNRPTATEVVTCSHCGAEVTFKGPLDGWPKYSQMTEVQQIQGSVRRIERWPPKLAEVGPPQILCSSCGEVLEKADDCFRCRCGREVRP